MEIVLPSLIQPSLFACSSLFQLRPQPSRFIMLERVENGNGLRRCKRLQKMPAAV
jgi:hypothetical protein